MMSEEENINQLYIKYRNKISKIALSFIKNPYLSEDISHEVFLKVYYNREKFMGICSLDTWVYKVTKNYCIDYLRSSHIKNVVPSEDVDLFLNQNSTPEDELIIKYDSAGTTGASRCGIPIV